jgi:hypothetical protein
MQCMAPRPDNSQNQQFSGGLGALQSAFSDNPASSSPGGGRGEGIYGNGNTMYTQQMPTRPRAPSWGQTAAAPPVSSNGWQNDTANRAGGYQTPIDETPVLLKIIVIGDTAPHAAQRATARPFADVGVVAPFRGQRRGENVPVE